MSLAHIIVQEIKTKGPISFHDFMEMALYYPGEGYYTSEGEKIGTGGDFYTSPCYSSLFAKMIAKQFEEMWLQLGKVPFTIVEYGAGTGILCRDVLNELQCNNELYDKLEYCIIEKSAAMQQKEKQVVSNKVKWYDSIKNISPFTGCIFSNELIDNFAVHRVVMMDELMEVFVDYNDGFVEVLKPSSSFLKDYLSQLQIVLPKGYKTEINLEANQWISDVATSLKKGYVLTIDYGYSSEGLYHACRQEGSLVCYHRHRVHYDPYINIGEQDITTHVNFSALVHWGKKSGLAFTGFTNQAFFLMALGLAAQSQTEQISGQSANFLRTLLVDLGRRIKVLVQHKGEVQSTISGLRFNQPLN